jgi:hypothetical protein
MALTKYQLQTTQLLQNPAAQSPLYATSDITTYINRARRQVAGEHQCIHAQATLALSFNNQVYTFSSFNYGPINNLVAGTFNVRMITLFASVGQTFVDNVPWEWFNQYYAAAANPIRGTPTIWAQFGQGSLGTLLFYPIPSGNIVAAVDAVVFPIDLVDDTTIELIPDEWTDAICFYAAFLALLSAQNNIRSAEADKMFERYQEFGNRARAAATSDVLPFHFEKSGVKYAPNPGGIKPPQGK